MSYKTGKSVRMRNYSIMQVTLSVVHSFKEDLKEARMDDTSSSVLL